MELQKLAVKEQLVKTVVKSGNGGAVWVPKDWLGEEVVVILPEEPKLNLKEKIIHLLEPYLKDIISVAIYGSYARKEQTKDSDVDVLVITKDKKLKLKFKEDKLELTSFPIDNLKLAIEKYPTIYYQMVQEAEPLINAYILEELKSIKPNKEGFKNYLKESKEHIKSNKELLELDKIDNTYLKSYSVVYSSMLRLRGVFIIKCILENSKFSNKKFKNWLKAKGLNRIEYEDCYKAYRLVRNNENTKKPKIKIQAVEKLINILENELNLLEEQIDK
ncbi:DUF2080 family transposase-associated protein [Candidatus Woesearchaeota archaeon]|nr:DUF2080 family transposase-associated protein [Candidatus Woesearchaeota archaeon]